MPEIKDLSALCKQAVEFHGCNEETLIKSELAQSYLSELMKAD